MLADFNALSSNSRIWIYQADRILTKNEETDILDGLSSFLGQWAAHGNSLKASGQVLHRCFLIISTDESFNMASGCSIDSSFQFVQELGARMSVDFFQRTNLAFLINNEVNFIQLSVIKSKIEEGVIHPDTLFFDNTIQRKSQLENKWCVKAGESWLARYFRSVTSV